MINVKTISCFCVVLIALAMSCVRSKSSVENEALKTLKVITGINLNHYKAIIFVPATGCGGCINNAEQYLLQFYIPGKRKGIFYVLTGYSSEKSAIARLGKQILNHKDILVDSKHQFDMPPFLMQFPKAFFLESDDIQRVIEINPDNSSQIYAALDAI